jgi:hypothetical protein
MTNEADVLIVTATKVESSAVIQAFEKATDYNATPTVNFSQSLERGWALMPSYPYPLLEIAKQ